MAELFGHLKSTLAIPGDYSSMHSIACNIKRNLGRVTIRKLLL